MAETYTFVYTDPQTGEQKRETRKRATPLTDQERQQLIGMGITIQAKEEKAAPKEKASPAPSKAKLAAEGVLGLVPGVNLARSVVSSPTAQKFAAEHPTYAEYEKLIAEAAPYIALGAINPPAAALETVPALGAWLVAHPQLVAGALQTLGAGVIGGTEAALEGKDVGQAAKGSAVVQGILSTLAPPVVKIAQRLGGGAMRKLEDTVAGQLMTRVKGAMAGWFDSLSGSHEGVRDLVEFGKGQEILSQRYGQALAAVKDAVPEGDMMVLGLEDARALKIPDTIAQPVLPPAYAGKGLSVTEAAGLNVPVTEVTVPTRTVIDKVHGIGKKDPGLSSRILDKLDSALGEIEASLPAEFREARRLYGTGKSVINGLKDVNIIDEGTKRVNVERFSKGSSTLDEQGRSVYERSMRSPEARQIFKQTIPPGKAPHAYGLPFVKAGPTHGYVGVHQGPESVAKVLENMQPPSIGYSGNIPFTEAEKEVQRLAPGVIHAGAKAIGATP